jgi:hypothetical protein
LSFHTPSMDLNRRPPGIRLPLFRARQTTYEKGPHHGELFKLFFISLKNEKIAERSCCLSHSLK